MHTRILSMGAKAFGASALKKYATRLKNRQYENWRSALVQPLTSAEMRSLENKVLETGSVTGLELMERAGQGVVDAIIHQWPDASTAPADVLVLCGPGNNGGDGFVVARLMKALGHRVQALFYGKREKLSQDAGRNYDLWRGQAENKLRQLGFPDLTTEDQSFIDSVYAEPSRLVVVDALFGIGLDRPLTALQPVLNAHARRRKSQPEPSTYCVAVDVASGISDDGPVSENPNSVLQADLTVTFHQIKKAHVAAPDFCGTVVAHDIGL